MTEIARLSPCPHVGRDCRCKCRIAYVVTQHGLRAYCNRSGQFPADWDAPTAFANVDCEAPPSTEVCRHCDHWDGLLGCKLQTEAPA